MIALLNLRLIAGLALVAALAFSHFTAYRKGKAHVRLEWDAAKAAAVADARRLETLRQSRVDEAGRAAAARETRLRADAAGAGDAVRRLRDVIAARDMAEQSAGAAAQRAAALGELLVAGAEAHRELAARCDRHVNDLQLLLQAWPK